jgi:hypothetical protein
MKTTLSLLLVASLAALPNTAAAEREQLIESGRIHLGEIVPNLPTSARTLDLGAAPRAGGSRLISVEELNRALKAAGEIQTVTTGVRVVRASKRWSQPELVAWISPAVTQALPSFATLIRLEVPRSLLTPTTAAIGNVELAQLPKIRGTVHTSAVISVTVDGELEQRLSFPVVLELGEQPKPVSVPRGQNLTVSITLGLARISASAVTLHSVAVGEIALCRILKTKKVLRARLLTPSTAEVLSE